MVAPRDRVHGPRLEARAPAPGGQGGPPRGVDRIVELVEQLAERHGVEYTVPITELVRGSGALNRGLAVEQLLDPELSVEAFEEMHVAYIRGLTNQKQREKEQS